MRSRWRGLLSGLAALAACAWLTACGPPGTPNEESSAVGVSSLSAGGQAAFESGFYSFAKTQGCVKCHASAVQPTFAAPDPSAAYLAAKGARLTTGAPYIDFATPANSIFIVYAGNNHCADAACSNPAVRPQVQDLLSIWATAELSAQVNGQAGPPGGGSPPPTVKFLTAAMKLPVPVPNLQAAAPALLRFPLAKFGIASLQKAVLEIEVNVSTPDTYRVSRPKIAGNTAAVTITGLHIYANPAGQPMMSEDLTWGSAWGTLSATAAVFALPNPVPTTALRAIPLSTTSQFLQVVSPADEIVIGIDDIK